MGQHIVESTFCLDMLDATSCGRQALHELPLHSDVLTWGCSNISDGCTSEASLKQLLGYMFHTQCGLLYSVWPYLCIWQCHAIRHCQPDDLPLFNTVSLDSDSKKKKKKKNHFLYIQASASQLTYLFTFYVLETNRGIHRQHQTLCNHTKLAWLHVLEQQHMSDVSFGDLFDKN